MCSLHRLDINFARGTFLRDLSLAPNQPTFCHKQHKRNHLALDIFGDSKTSKGDINKPLVNQEFYLLRVSRWESLLSFVYASDGQMSNKDTVQLLVVCNMFSLSV